MSLLDVLASLGLSTAAWQLDEPRGLPVDLVTLADPRDPLAQSQLWGALYPEIPIGFLVETCLVESGCMRAIGVHDLDEELGESAWRGVWQRHRVDHDCSFYPDPSTVDASWFREASTRGNHGLIAAYHIALIGDCVPLDALDLPFFSGWAAAEKARDACASLRSRKMKCTRERLRCAWAHVPAKSKACRATVRRFRFYLAKRIDEMRVERPDFDPRERFTLADFRKQGASWRTTTDH